MTIKDPAVFCAALWDWAVLDGCFKGNIRPTDIDGLVEYRGSFLFLETKGVGVPVPKGQAIAFSNLSKLPGVEVWVVWGDPGDPVAMARYADGKRGPQRRIDLNGLRRACAAWFSRAAVGGTSGE